LTDSGMKKLSTGTILVITITICDIMDLFDLSFVVNKFNVMILQ